MYPHRLRARSRGRGFRGPLRDRLRRCDAVVPEGRHHPRIQPRGRVLLQSSRLRLDVRRAGAVRHRDIADLAELAKRLRPDRAIRAIMEAGTGPRSELDAAAQELAAVGITFELITALNGSRTKATCRCDGSEITS